MLAVGLGCGCRYQSRSRVASQCWDQTYHDLFSSVVVPDLFLVALELEPVAPAAAEVVVAAVLDVSLPPELQ